MQFIIDLDGTLLNSMKRHYVLLQDILESKGNNSVMRWEMFKNMKASGCSTRKICTEGFGISPELTEEVANEWVLHIEDAEYLKLDYLYEDAEMFLQQLKKRGSISILTARKNKQRALEQIAALGLEKYAGKTMVVNPGNVVAEKKAILIAEAKKENIIMIGDTEADYDAALQADVPCFVLNRGFRNKEYWDRRGVSSFKSLNELLSEV